MYDDDKYLAAVNALDDAVGALRDLDISAGDVHALVANANQNWVGEDDGSHTAT